MKRREVDFRDFDAVAEDVQQLHERGYDRAGQWDLAQVCRHLTIAMEQSLTGFTYKAPWWMRQLVVFFVKGKLFRTRRIKPGVKAPIDMVPPPGGDQAKAVADFRQMLTRIDQSRGSFQAHPVFGQLTDDQWRQFHLIHIAHHLSFLVPRPHDEEGPVDCS